MELELEGPDLVEEERAPLLHRLVALTVAVGAAAAAMVAPATAATRVSRRKAASIVGTRWNGWIRIRIRIRIDQELPSPSGHEKYGI